MAALNSKILQSNVSSGFFFLFSFSWLFLAQFHSPFYMHLDIQ